MHKAIPIAVTGSSAGPPFVEHKIYLNLCCQLLLILATSLLYNFLFYRCSIFVWFELNLESISIFNCEIIFVEVNTSIKIVSSKEKVFAALITPSQIIQWWQAYAAIVVARESGLFAVRWGDEDDPDYVSAATIVSFAPPDFMRLENFIYYAKGQPEVISGDLPTEFRLSDNEGKVELRVIQSGFSADKQDFMEACKTGWRNVLIAIKELVEN